VASLSNAWSNIGLVQHLNLHDAPPAMAAYEQALALARQKRRSRGKKTWDRIYLGRLLLETSAR
jgi:hypothetical protein